MKILKHIVFKMLKLIPDKTYLKLIFYYNMGYKLNLKNPKTFNEKIQRLKLYDRNPIYTNMVDKYEAKKYVGGIIGEEYIIPTLGVYNAFDEIDIDKLPNQFVLKCTHDSGGVIICKDKKEFDIEAARLKIKKSLSNNYYYQSRERVYKNIKPRIIAEKYMVDESGVELKDYKVFCFNGEPKIVQVDYDRFSDHRRNIYDLDRNFLSFEILYPSDKNHQIKKPVCLKEMIDLSRKLSGNIPHVRVDFYIANNHIYFGEMTFYHGGGYEEFRPKERDYKFGDLIKLPVL